MKKKKILYFLSGVGIIILLIIFLMYRNLYGINIKPKEINQVVFIPTGSSYRQVFDTLESNLIIKILKVLEWVA